MADGGDWGIIVKENPLEGRPASTLATALHGQPIVLGLRGRRVEGDGERLGICLELYRQHVVLCHADVRHERVQHPICVGLVLCVAPGFEGILEPLDELVFGEGAAKDEPERLFEGAAHKLGEKLGTDGEQLVVALPREPWQEGRTASCALDIETKRVDVDLDERDRDDTVAPADENIARGQPRSVGLGCHCAVRVAQAERTSTSGRTSFAKNTRHEQDKNFTNPLARH